MKLSKYAALVRGEGLCCVFRVHNDGLINRMRYGGTHADDAPPRQAGNFFQFCGQPLRVIGTERFCNNVNCQNRYINV